MLAWLKRLFGYQQPSLETRLRHLAMMRASNYDTRPKRRHG